MPVPATVPRWSDVDPASTTTEPTSGEKDAGFVANTPASSKYTNWLFYWIYQWIVWFSSAKVRSHPAASGWVGLIAGWAPVGGNRIETATTTATWHVEIPLEVGDVVSQVRFRVLPGGATNTLTCAISVFTDGVQTATGSAVSTEGAAAEWVTISDPMTGYVFALGDQCVATIAASGAGAGTRTAYHVEATVLAGQS